jgi:hypothetical protein
MKHLFLIFLLMEIKDVEFSITLINSKKIFKLIIEI